MPMSSATSTITVQHRQRFAVQIKAVIDAHHLQGQAGRRVRARTKRNRGYHFSKPFCQTSTRSRTRNSRLTKPEHTRANTKSAAYMLA